MSSSAQKNKPSAPLTFELPVDLMEKIEACRKTMGLTTVSEVIRTAVERFDFTKCQPVHLPQRQISVRLSAEHRHTLRRQARLKDVSVGELLRLAIEGLQARPARRR